MARNKPAGTIPANEYGDPDWSLSVPMPVEPGVYAASIKSVERRESESDGRSWLAWTFLLADGREIGGGSSFSLSVRSKSFAWISAVVGRALLGGGATITPMDLLNHSCQIVVEDTDEPGISKVSAVLPPAKP